MCGTNYGDDVLGFFGLGDIITLPDYFRDQKIDSIFPLQEDVDVARLPQLAGAFC